ncbi:Gfo/Idh/MocA family oxidoreductase [Microbacterium sp. YMB-B2]|uniref:Gfo/Idh/MocA family oxidoreductase n=1 Tax=Microbacterium tenebrionis TaxID=2830665 RepID=A0A9X1LNA5_9MICO|nr:Gfo/Idh/MocA family oxidoreductase [Microbacterium tenebrionis]MCC2028878.1 Gfo/Idh/MocA family oxidoreductase [Microbacterium tenebrionis]
MTKLKVGIIGLGFIGTQKHLPGLASQSEEVEIRAFCDLELSRAENARAEFGVDESYATADWHAVVADDTLDVIHVCTWNTSHREITIAALEAGKHVMVEKPMAVTGEDARAMLEASRRTGKKLTVGYQYRWREDNKFLRSAVDEGRLGEIYHARGHAVRRRGVPIWGSFTDKDKQGGGPLIDLGTHALDLALWFMGNYEVASVTGTVFHKLGDKPEGNMGGEWDPATFHVEDSAFGYVTMKNGATVFLEAAWALNVPQSREACVTLAGTDGGAESRQLGAQWEASLNGVVGGQLTETAPDFKGAYFGASSSSGSGFTVLGAQEAAQWVRAIKTDTDPLVLPEQACVVTEILDGIYRSAASGQPVTF